MTASTGVAQVAAPVRRHTPRLRECSRCGRAMRANSATAATLHPGTLVCIAGGLCSACWSHAYRRRQGPVRAYHRHGDVLDEYQHLTTGARQTRRGIAAQLGIGPEALNAHLRRARKRGDPRARKEIPL